MSTNYCLVAANTPFNNSLLTYREGSFSTEIKEGDLVRVPLGTRVVNGCIVKTKLPQSSLDKKINTKEIKEIKEVLKEYYPLSQGELEFFKWISVYYHYPLGQLIFDILPKSLKKPRKLKFYEGEGIKLPFSLNRIQDEIYKKIKQKGDEDFSKSLLHGVTGSGKTAIYLNLIRDVLNNEKSVLFLLPEINLTPQFLTFFSKHLDCKIYSYNSSLSNSDKYGLWKLLNEDSEKKVIIGVRSSIFLPIKNLGLIIVDEEHDSSFKQEDRCPYNARDLAIKKASIWKIPVVLGSATPTCETYFRFKESGDEYFALENRVAVAAPPRIELVDMRGEADKELWPLSEQGCSKIETAIERNEQVLVFVNSLGFASYLQCRACGHDFHCPNCHSNLRYYRQRSEILCHHCGYKDRYPEICPKCDNMSILQKGFGTERLEQVLKEKFPAKKIERFDRDVITTAKKLEETLERFHRGDIDILVGTQMLSKGHNFERVNLVLVLGVDSLLNYPDFRAQERVYQLLTQVSGRSGRYGKESEVLIHTLNKDNKLFDYVLKNTFDSFYVDELKLRRSMQLPPYERIALLSFTAKTQERVIEVANHATHALTSLQKKHFEKVEVMGPRPAFIEKRVNKFTWVTMLKSEKPNELHNLISNLMAHLPSKKDYSLKIDVDPYFIG